MCSEVLQQITQNTKTEEHLQGQQQEEDCSHNLFKQI